jgi:putative DNA primase/helicase
MVMAVTNDELGTLLTDSALAAIHPDTPLAQIEAALRSLAESVALSDPLRRAVVREATIQRLRQAGVGSPAVLADAAFGPEPKRDYAIERASRLRLNTAEPWPEPVRGSDLLDQMAAAFSRFLVLSPAAAAAEALWCLNTYTYDAAGVLPNLCISSLEKRCGKTRNLEILGCLVQRPLHTANITPAALYRTIDCHQPTLLIDEADTIFVNGGNAELRGLLNAGLYRSSAFVLRCGNRKEPQWCSVWCPKAIALIGRLPETLEDRSIVIPMRRKEEPLETYRYERVRDLLEPLRRKAVRWVRDHGKALADVEPMPLPIHDRAQDIWQPLLSIAEVVGEDWPERARTAALALSGMAHEHNSLAISLLNDVRSIFIQRQAARLPSRDIVRELARMTHRRWPDWNGGTPMTPIQLASMLSELGIRPKVIRHGQREVSRGYRLQDLPPFPE